MVFGATSTVLWHSRHAWLLIWIGRARYSVRPVGVSRSPVVSVVVGERRNWLMMSDSQSVARSRGFVGLSVASLYAKSECFLRNSLHCSVAATAGTDLGRK